MKIQIAVFIVATTLLAHIAAASDKKSVNCYDMAVGISSTFTQDGPDGKRVFLRTGGTICVTEKNMTDHDEYGLISTGDIKIVITDDNKKVAEYKLNARSGDGAAGTYYISYAAQVADLLDDSGDSNYKIIQFAMRNDRIKRGEYAGRLALNRNEIILLKR